MNIESLIEKIKLFEKLVIDSGFRRDVQDYITSTQQPQNQNLVFMKDLSEKVKTKLKEIDNYGLAEELEIVLKNTTPFTSLETLKQLVELDADTEVAANAYYSSLNQILNSLIQSIDLNKDEVDGVLSVFENYTDEEKEYETEANQALVSLVFKDAKTTGTLKEFSKSLHRWNRMLLIYQSLLTSETTDDIHLVEVQNGSIDVIFNIDFDIALDLIELLETGLKVYSAYLLYKSKTAREIIASYMGNQSLIDGEKEREKHMLDNIETSISTKALEQHQERLEKDQSIDRSSTEAKLKDVSAVIADHIVKGNEFKLLTKTEPVDGEEIEIPERLRVEIAQVRERYRELNPADQQVLLDKFTIKDEEQKER